MTNEERLRKEQEERLREEAQLRELDNLKKKNFSPNNPSLKDSAEASPHAPIFPCVKCRRSHRKGQCKGP